MSHLLALEKALPLQARYTVGVDDSPSTACARATRRFRQRRQWFRHLSLPLLRWRVRRTAQRTAQEGSSRVRPVQGWGPAPGVGLAEARVQAQAQAVELEVGRVPAPIQL
jgi:hypothetical protein